MISVIVPVLNEEKNIEPLLKEIIAIPNTVPITEIIYVDDGSIDQTYAILKSLKKDCPYLRILKHNRRSGQSSALWTGVKASTNDIIVTLDGDGQNDPADIGLLWDRFKAGETSTPRLMVMGERKKRNDSIMRRIASRSANGIRSAILHDKTKDTGCSLKLFRRKDYLNLPYFDHMHRFLPALMMRDNVILVNIPVSHRSRVHGISKYNNLGRAIVGLSDLLGVWWLLKRPHACPEISEEVSGNDAGIS